MDPIALGVLAVILLMFGIVAYFVSVALMRWLRTTGLLAPHRTVRLAELELKRVVALNQGDIAQADQLEAEIRENSVG